MPKYGYSITDSQKEDFSKCHHFLKRASDFASYEPSMTPRYPVKVELCEKRGFGLLCPNKDIRPQTPKKLKF